MGERTSRLYRAGVLVPQLSRDCEGAVPLHSHYLQQNMIESDVDLSFQIVRFVDDAYGVIPKVEM
jgi:hypothetical protein